MEEELKKLFVELMRFSKDVSPEIWAILVKQAITIGIMYLLASFFSVACFFQGLRILRDRPTWALIDDEINIGGGIWAGISGFIAIIMVICLFTDALPRLLNPAYYALMALKP